MLHLLAETEAAVNWPIEIARILGPGVIVLLGLWVWHLQKRSEPKYELLGYLNQRRLDGLLKAWSLLAYITEVENPKAVMLWEKDRNEAVYYIRKKQATEYMNALSAIFYDGGYGLLFSREVKDLFYEYRGHLYGVLLKDKSGQENDRIKIEKTELVSRMREIYNKLNAQLREDLKKIEK